MRLSCINFGQELGRNRSVPPKASIVPQRVQGFSVVAFEVPLDLSATTNIFDHVHLPWGLGA